MHRISLPSQPPPPASVPSLQGSALTPRPFREERTLFPSGNRIFWGPFLASNLFSFPRIPGVWRLQWLQVPTNQHSPLGQFLPLLPPALSFLLPALGLKGGTQAQDVLCNLTTSKFFVWVTPGLHCLLCCALPSQPESIRPHPGHELCWGWGLLASSHLPSAVWGAHVLEGSGGLVPVCLAFPRVSNWVGEPPAMSLPISLPRVQISPELQAGMRCFHLGAQYRRVMHPRCTPGGP